MSEKTNTKIERPLSPHLQVYRLPYNALMSIIGRAAGIFLAIVLMVLCGWFIAVVWSPELYDKTLAFIETPYTKYAFLGLAFVVFFYLGNGIRHVLFHIGVGLNEKAGIISGNLVLLVAALLTVGLWSMGCNCIEGKTIPQDNEKVEAHAE